ncbi:MAG: DNA polymerase III subunit chi [Sterolibacterium sp.]|jgi:DNA polymerase-3 subunit chi|nr:DNA polymerase III subunit chi [Sterolibacterium sp.]
MTRILICHNATDRLQAAVFWLAQEFVWNNADTRTTLYIPDAHRANQIDQLLWSHPPTGFLPHCRAHSPLVAETPIIIAETIDELDGIPRSTYLLNLDDTQPPGFEHYLNLIEIISQEESVRQPGRERARYYREQGHDIQYRDLQKEPL